MGANSVGIRCSNPLVVGFTHSPFARCQLPDTGSLRPCQEPPSRHIQIRQAAADLEPVGVLRQPSVADFGPSKDPLDHQERVLHFRPDFRFRAVASSRLLTQRPMAMRFRLDETLGLGRLLSDHLALPTVG
jgi:hypothetical protein